MNTRLLEKIGAAVAVLLLAALMLWAALDTRRRARDTERVSLARQAQAGVELFRARHASYPGKAEDLGGADAALLAGLSYAAEPAGCGASEALACRSYAMHLRLEGRVGGLLGGACTVTPESFTCVQD